LAYNLGSVYNTAVTADPDIFASDLVPVLNKNLLRIYAAFDASDTLALIRNKGEDTVSELLNGGNALTENAAYIFDVIVDAGETINLQYGGNADALKVSVLSVEGED
jgi:hypothetical protein